MAGITVAGGLEWAIPEHSIMVALTTEKEGVSKRITSPFALSWVAGTGASNEGIDRKYLTDGHLELTNEGALTTARRGDWRQDHLAFRFELGG